MSKQTNDFQQLIAMVVELLEDGMIVEESKEFPDPETGVMREVDLYALIQGKANGRQITIAVECVDRKRKRDAPWVEMIYGKHSRLQVADVVLLVSSSGFYRPAELKARKFGYKTIHPAISEKRLARAIFGSPQMGMNIGDVRLVGVRVTASAPGLTDDFRVLHDDLDQCPYLRADGVELVRANKFAMDSVLQAITQGGGNFAMGPSSQGTQSITVTEPTHNGERLHVEMQSAAGQIQIPASLDAVEIIFSYSSTGMTMHNPTHGGDFGGADFATGTGQIGDYPSRFTIVNTPTGQRGMLRTQYNIPENPPGEA